MKTKKARGRPGLWLQQNEAPPKDFLAEMTKVSSNRQPASDRQSGGGEEDGVLKLMRRYGIPITRQNYLDFAYMGEVPAR